MKKIGMWLVPVFWVGQAAIWFEVAQEETLRPELLGVALQYALMSTLLGMFFIHRARSISKPD